MGSFMPMLGECACSGAIYWPLWLWWTPLKTNVSRVLFQERRSAKYESAVIVLRCGSTRSFTKAATLHDMDNSSLSKQIKKLEQDLGVQLLNRSTRSFSLTSAGEDILAQTYVLKDTINQIQGIADSYQSEPKGAANYFTDSFWSAILATYHYSVHEKVPWCSDCT